MNGCFDSFNGSRKTAAPEHNEIYLRIRSFGRVSRFPSYSITTRTKQNCHGHVPNGTPPSVEQTPAGSKTQVAWRRDRSSNNAPPFRYRAAGLGTNRAWDYAAALNVALGAGD
ncbi:unnamed protein product, partial [Iphiclides podalirius]